MRERIIFGSQGKNVPPKQRFQACFPPCPVLLPRVYLTKLLPLSALTPGQDHPRELCEDSHGSFYLSLT